MLHVAYNKIMDISRMTSRRWRGCLGQDELLLEVIDCNLKGKHANQHWCLTILSLVFLFFRHVFEYQLVSTWPNFLFLSLDLQFCLTCYIFLLQEHKSAKTVGEMKQYVQRIPFMQRAKSSLATRKEFKRMMLAFLFISFTSRDTPFLTKYYITYFEDHSYSVKSQRKRTKTSASDFVLLQRMAQLFPPFSCVV